jgi:CHAT domain-containing protein
MKEIVELNINADFVNLSACETGLGKIYGGEGVVGLTQSFLVAGANGLSVSLWQVADESTMELMVGMYRLVKEKGLSYDRAITEMKREFIRSNKYSDPFYWAPFVYYGALK